MVDFTLPMIEITNFSLQNPTNTLSGHGFDPEGTLFLDIETTGLSPVKNRVCLIGCAFLCDDNNRWQIVQLFDETGSSEKGLLSLFLDFLQCCDTVIHFNGRAFDLPFLEKRAAANGIPLSFSGKHSVDLYRILISRKSILGLPNYRQQTVEAAVGTGRTDSTSGRDFVDGYYLYLRTRSEEAKKQILLHNHDDMEGLLSLAPVLSLDSLEDIRLTVTRGAADTARTADGSFRDSLYLECSLSDALPLPVRAHRDGCLMKAEKNRCFLTVPLFTGELKLFFTNYREYYYLPEEDRAIHRSVGAFVERSHRVSAKAQTCYERVRGTFLPSFGKENGRFPHFRENYRSKNTYILFDDKIKCDQKALSRYAGEVFRYLVQK